MRQSLFLRFPRRNLQGYKLYTKRVYHTKRTIREDPAMIDSRKKEASCGIKNGTSSLMTTQLEKETLRMLLHKTEQTSSFSTLALFSVDQTHLHIPRIVLLNYYQA